MTTAQIASALRAVGTGVLTGGTLTPLLIGLFSDKEPKLSTLSVMVLIFAWCWFVASWLDRDYIAVRDNNLRKAMLSLTDVVDNQNHILETHDKILENRFHVVKYWDEEQQSFQWRFVFDE